MKLEDINIVYFLGIGGIGMSALARWFKHHHCFVAGYDRTATALTKELEKEGMFVHFEDNIDLIPEEVRVNKENVVVVYTPAIPKDNKEFNYLKDNGFSLKKRSEILGIITKDKFTVAVAGTHGKTTTSSMIAHILKSSGENCAAFLGGITQNYNSNLLLENDPEKESIVVVEADEYDRSFLTLFPNMAVVTSADADHLDIYGDKSEVTNSFKAFISQISSGGSLFLKETLEKELLTKNENDINIHKYSLNKGDFHADNISIQNGTFTFDFISEKKTIKDVSLIVPGYHNIENAVAAMSVALGLGVEEAKVKEAISSYGGVKRRFEYIIKEENLVFIDDYAHHPVELHAFLKSLKALYSDRKVTAIFQPHLYTRTRDFAEEFAESLNIADEVLLMDIYPARELPISGVTSEIIFKNVKVTKALCTKATLLEEIKKREIEVIATIGAGDIDTFIQPIAEVLKKKKRGN